LFGLSKLRSIERDTSVLASGSNKQETTKGTQSRQVNERGGGSSPASKSKSRASKGRFPLMRQSNIQRREKEEKKETYYSKNETEKVPLFTNEGSSLQTADQEEKRESRREKVRTNSLQNADCKTQDKKPRPKPDIRPFISKNARERNRGGNDSESAEAQESSYCNERKEGDSATRKSPANEGLPGLISAKRCLRACLVEGGGRS